MTIPPFILRLLSTSHYGHFPPYDNFYKLAADWPMNGNRDWAIRCAEWLDGYLATQPTPRQALHLIYNGWQEGILLAHEEEYAQLLSAIRDRLVREIPNWQYEYDYEYPFDPYTETQQ